MLESIIHLDRLLYLREQCQQQCQQQQQQQMVSVMVSDGNGGGGGGGDANSHSMMSCALVPVFDSAISPRNMALVCLETTK